MQEKAQGVRLALCTAKCTGSFILVDGISSIIGTLARMNPTTFSSIKRWETRLLGCASFGTIATKSGPLEVPHDRVRIGDRFIFASSDGLVFGIPPVSLS